MTRRRFELETELPVSASAAYAWHARPGAFERLIPPWEDVRVLERAGGIESGRVVAEVPVGPVRRRWVARHRDAVPGRQFVDEQIEGPFESWVHHHVFEPIGPDRCRLRDEISYELPFGPLGDLAAGAVVDRLTRGFRYRHATLRDDLALLSRRPPGLLRTVLVTGATGLVGRALVTFLQAAGCRVRRVTRHPAGPEDIPWNPAEGKLDPAALEGTDAVVHLAGEPIAGGRWSSEQRERILQSRVRGTTLLAETLARLPRRPAVLISASGINIYGDRGTEVLTEQAGLRTSPEPTFIEQVAQAWEQATEPAERAGIRVVRARFGMVLSPAGGALAQMLPPFEAGLGGRLGSGEQYLGWISIDDVIGALYHALTGDALRGPINVTAPEPVTNQEFTSVLGRVLHRPTVIPVPGAGLRLLFGDLADELLLASTRVVPARLMEAGYVFRHPDLAQALRHVLGR